MVVPGAPVNSAMVKVTVASEMLSVQLLSS